MKSVELAEVAGAVVADRTQALVKRPDTECVSR